MRAQAICRRQPSGSTRSAPTCKRGGRPRWSGSTCCSRRPRRRSRMPTRRRGTARAALAEKDRAIRMIETGLAGLGKELAKLGDRSGAGPQGSASGAAPGPSDAERRDEIAIRQKALSEQATTEAAARVRLATDVDARAAESQRCAAEITRLDAERKAALQPIDADLERRRQASLAATNDRARVGRDQEERFRDLGAALYDARHRRSGADRVHAGRRRRGRGPRRHSGRDRHIARADRRYAARHDGDLRDGRAAGSSGARRRRSWRLRMARPFPRCPWQLRGSGDRVPST